MTRLHRIAAIGAAVSSFGVAGAFNSALIVERNWNDMPDSALTTTNNYPSLIRFAETGLNETGKANQHRWYLSADGGSTAMMFGLNSYFVMSARFTLWETGAGNRRQEGGFIFDTLGWDGKFMVASDGEIAVFGNILPFHRFAQTYTPGNTIELGLRYFRDPTDNLRKLEYRVGAESAIYVMTNMEQGLLANTRIGGYSQNQGDAADVASVTTQWQDIEAVPEPATLAVLGAGLAALAARRRRKSS